MYVSNDTMSELISRLAQFCIVLVWWLGQVLLSRKRDAKVRKMWRTITDACPVRFPPRLVDLLVYIGIKTSLKPKFSPGPVVHVCLRARVTTPHACEGVDGRGEGNGSIDARLHRRSVTSPTYLSIGYGCSCVTCAKYKTNLGPRSVKRLADCRHCVAQRIGRSALQQSPIGEPADGQTKNIGSSRAGSQQTPQQMGTFRGRQSEML